MRKLLLIAGFLVATPSIGWCQNLGDTVYLKSGSPAMTVTSIIPRADQAGTDIGVHWFGNALMFAGTFPASSVVTSDPRPAIEKVENDERLRVFPVVVTTPPVVTPVVTPQP